MIAASAALTISGVPFMGPIAAARVGYKDGEYQLNPTMDQVKEGELDLVVAGTHDAVMMVESEAKELSEDVMLGARHVRPPRAPEGDRADHQARREGRQGPLGAARARRHVRGQGQAQDADRQGPRGRLQADQQGRAPERDQRRPHQGARGVRGRRARRSRAISRQPEAGEEARGGDRPRRDPEDRQAHRRPRHQDGPPDRGDRRLPAAHPRLGSVHPRRDPGDLHDHAWAPRKPSR